jgi:hypothetical protein
LPIPRQTVENIISFENAVKGVHAHSHQGSISESDSPRANEEEEPAASEGLKVEGLKVVKKRRRRCGSSFSATFDFKTLRLSDAAGSSNISDSSAAAGVES